MVTHRALTPPPPFDSRPVVVGGVLFAVLMALSTRYGFDRDELYFLDCGRHLSAAYVDQPVFTRVRTLATVTNPAGIHNQEWHGHVYLCTGLRGWAQTWPELRHYD